MYMIWDTQLRTYHGKKTKNNKTSQLELIQNKHTVKAALLRNMLPICPCMAYEFVSLLQAPAFYHD